MECLCIVLVSFSFLKFNIYGSPEIIYTKLFFYQFKSTEQYQQYWQQPINPSTQRKVSATVYNTFWGPFGNDGIVISASALALASAFQKFYFFSYKIFYEKIGQLCKIPYNILFCIYLFGIRTFLLQLLYYLRFPILDLQNYSAKYQSPLK